MCMYLKRGGFCERSLSHHLPHFPLESITQGQLNWRGGGLRANVRREEEDSDEFEVRTGRRHVCMLGV